MQCGSSVYPSLLLEKTAKQLVVFAQSAPYIAAIVFAPCPGITHHNSTPGNNLYDWMVESQVRAKLQYPAEEKLLSEAHSTAKCFFLLPFMENSHALLERESSEIRYEM